MSGRQHGGGGSSSSYLVLGRPSDDDGTEMEIDNDNDGNDSNSMGRPNQSTYPHHHPSSVPSTPQQQQHQYPYGYDDPPDDGNNKNNNCPPHSSASTSQSDRRNNNNNTRGRPKTPPRTPTTQTPPAKKRQSHQEHPQCPTSSSHSHSHSHSSRLDNNNEEEEEEEEDGSSTTSHRNFLSSGDAIMTVIIGRVDLFDSGGASSHNNHAPVSDQEGGDEAAAEAIGTPMDEDEGGDGVDSQCKPSNDRGQGHGDRLSSTPPHQTFIMSAMQHTPPPTPPSKPQPPPRSPLPKAGGGDVPRINIGTYRYVKPGGDNETGDEGTGAPTVPATSAETAAALTLSSSSSSRTNGTSGPATAAAVVVVRVPHVPVQPPPTTTAMNPSNGHDNNHGHPGHQYPFPPAAASSSSSFWMNVAVLDKHSQPLPPNMDPKLSKYWYQRRRLFHKFDDGIQLDDEGWFSVSPEQVADHVSHTVGNVLRRSSFGSLGVPQPRQQQAPPSLVMLDAFCGCGGNAISFAKCLAMGPNPCLSLVVAVDMDRAKLRRAAHNAGIYRIPTNRIVFVEANVLFLLEHAYQNGEFVLDQPITSQEAADALMLAMPPPVETEMVSGYCIGGIDLLPRTISLVHLDPPWGGVEYQVLGKNGYDLHRNMKIQRPSVTNRAAAAAASAACTDAGAEHDDDGELHNDFFDAFCTAQHPASSSNHPHSSSKLSKQQRKAQFNSELDDDDCVSGEELLALAATATGTHIVSFDVPRNINRNRLGHAALKAGYRGNCRLEEQYLNGRLKTVTAYFGSDWSASLSDQTAVPQGPSQPKLPP